MGNFHLQHVGGLKFIEFGPAGTKAQGSRLAHKAQLGIDVCLPFLVSKRMPSSMGGTVSKLATP